MRSALKNYYITSKMIANRWNEQGYSGPLKNGKWDGDAISRKFRRFLDKIEEYLNKEKMELRNLFLSKWNEGSKGEWVFFNTSEMTALATDIKSVDSLAEGGFGKIREFYERWLPYYDEYGMNTYAPMDTYDTMKWIFDLCDNNKTKHVIYDNRITMLFTSEETDELKQRLRNLLPWFKSIDVLKEYVKNADVDGWKQLLEWFAESCQKIDSTLDKYYIETRNDIFFEKRLYDDRKSIRDVQYAEITAWSQGWVYVMDQVVRVRRDEEQFDFKNLPIRKIVECAIIWYLKEGNENTDLNEYDKEKDYLKQCREMVFDVISHKLRDQYGEDYNFIICESFWDLEQVYAFMEDNNRKSKENGVSAYLRAVHASINIIHPSPERIKMVSIRK